ncbi:MAG: LysR family transcriptional regulator [Pseudonocardiaceae bacterium]
MRLFLVLAQELHFGWAAMRLFITQSALSRQIRALEGHLGVTLVERTSRTVALTAAGQALLPEAREVVAAMSRLRHAANVQARQASGHLVIGSIGAEAAMPYSHAILVDLQRNPDITIEIRNLNFIDHIQALTRGDVDVVFLRPPVPAGIQTLHLATEPRVACLSADDALADEPHLTLAQLADRPVPDVPADVPRVWWDHWIVNPRPDGSPMRYGPVVTDMETLLHVVACGQAIIFLPAAARHMFPRPGVRYVDVIDIPPSAAALAWLPKNRNRPTIAAVREIALRRRNKR